MKKLSTAVLLALTSGQAFAEPVNSKLEETILTSSRIEMPLREVATSVSVITKEDIEIRGFSTLANVMRYEPAVSVTNNGGLGKTTQLRIRGEKGNRTKVYIDGIDVTDTSTPQAGPNFANLASAGIERVEILRGPQGMMYGADAGGVVNISTRAAEPGFGGSASAEYGRYDTQQYSGNIVGGNDVIDFSLSGSYLDTDGFNSKTTDTVLRDDDGYENTTFHGRLGWNISEKWRAEFVGRDVEGESEFDDCSLPVTFDPTDACTADYDQQAWRSALLYKGKVFTNSLSFNQHTSKRDFLSAGLSTFATEGELEKIEYHGTWSPDKVISLAYGVELQDESIDDGAVSTSRDQSGYYLEYQGNVAENLYLTVGTRYDDNDDFGSEMTYRASAAYLIPLASGEFKVKGTYGTGFRAPSLSEIAFNGGAGAFPPASDTELAEETSEGYELGAGYYANTGWYVDVVYFDQRIEDEIFFDLLDFSGYLQGSGESSSKGIELIAEVPLGDMVAVTGNYTYNDTEDADGVQRLRAPKHLANLGLQLTPMDGRLTINANIRLSQDRADERNGAVDDYEVLDISVNYQMSPALAVYGRVENATDEDYQEIPEYNVAGAAGYAGIRYAF